MKNIIKVLALSAAILSLTGCAKSRLEQMKMAENIKIDCTPEVLVATAGKIPVSVSVTYPKGYFEPKAMLEVTPVLVYEGGEQVGPTFWYQGEKVKDNNKVVAKDGGTVSEVFAFDYVPGVEKSHLELRSTASMSGYAVEIPAIKVADGTNTTYTLVKTEGVYGFKDDGYQAVIAGSTEGQILYDVNSANVKNSELRSASIKDFQAALKAIQADERTTVTGTQIVAYASPEGGESYNAKLSDKRAASAKKAWSSITKDIPADEALIKSIGQDWEGFKQAVQESNLRDKDLILRVLSMYSDPAVRENEIRNMSQVFTELKESVFPELRRARFIANTEYQNYTDEELTALLADGSDALDEPALLHAATLVSDLDQKIAIYRKAVSRFGSDVAQYNLGVCYLQKGEDTAAAAEFARVKADDADLANVKGVLALSAGDLRSAADYFRKAGDTPEAQANLGAIYILTGNYDAAVKALENAPGCCHNTVLSLILTNQLDKADATAKCQSPAVQYLRAIIAARKGNASGVKEYLDKAKASPKFAERAPKDIEVAAFN